MSHIDPTPYDSAEYAICQRRGHEQSGEQFTETEWGPSYMGRLAYGPTWSVCRWCGCRFRWTEPVLVEEDADQIALQMGAATPVPEDAR